MTARQGRPLVLLVVCALVAFASTFAPLGAQTPTKRPLSYDAFDYWRSIQGTRLSDDGQWLAYALTSQGEDGELVVRNVQGGQELKHPRGTNPQFTPDGKFVLFTIVPPKGGEDDEAEAEGAAPAGRGGAQGGGNQASRNEAGIMALPGGQVTSVAQIGNFRMPAESSAWVAGRAGRASVECRFEPRDSRGGRDL
jgi:hypothetical protein